MGSMAASERPGPRVPIPRTGRAPDTGALAKPAAAWRSTPDRMQNGGKPWTSAARGAVAAQGAQAGMDRTPHEIVEEQGALPARSSYALLLRLGRSRVVLLVTATTVLAACALTALVLVFAIDPVEPPSLHKVWVVAMSTAALVTSVLCPLIVLVMMDMLNQLERALQAAHRMAHTDALTGLSNRRDFIERAMRALEQGRAHGVPLSLLMVDLDDFKRINDTHGHTAGDRALAAVAAICGGTVTTGDLCARFGGEEFALLLRGCDRKRAMAAAETIRGQVERAPRPAARADTLPLTASIGCACSDETSHALDAMLALADKRLYQAKRSGKNRTEAGEGN